MYNMPKKIKKLTLQYSYLNLEYEEINEICEKMESEIRSYMEKNHPEYYKKLFDEPVLPSNINHDEEPVPGSEEEGQKESIPKNQDSRVLYRKIAARTHPDKTGDNSLSDLFDRAKKAYDNENIAELLDIAGSLNIELIDLSEETINLLKNNIKTISQEIDSKKTTAAWYWSQAQSEEDKEKISLMIIKAKGD